LAGRGGCGEVEFSGKRGEDEKSSVRGKRVCVQVFSDFTESFSGDKAQAICKHRTLAKRAYERTFKDK
jgi:hypothetical protein